MTLSSITETRGSSVEFNLPSVCNVSNPKIPVGCTETGLSKQLKARILDVKNLAAGSVHYRCNKLLQDDATYASLTKEEIDTPIEETSLGHTISFGGQSLLCPLDVEVRKFFQSYYPHFDSSKSEEILKSFKQTFPSQYHLAADLFVNKCLPRGGNCLGEYDEFSRQLAKVWNAENIELLAITLDLLTKIQSAAISVRAQKTMKETQIKVGETQSILKLGGCIFIATGETFTNGSKAYGKECQNGAWITRYTTDTKPRTRSTLKPKSNSPSNGGSCQDPTSGMLVKNGGSIKYSDGTRTCVNGKWSNPNNSNGSSSGSSSKTTKRAVKLQNCEGENTIKCRVLFSDGSVGYWTNRISGQVVDVWEYFWGSGRWCVRLYENGGIQTLLC